MKGMPLEMRFALLLAALASILWAAKACLVIWDWYRARSNSDFGRLLGGLLYELATCSPPDNVPP
jgi:hypothetical protein